MSTPARQQEPIRQSSQIVGDGDLHVALATRDGKMNAGPLTEWISAMQLRQAGKAYVKEWVAAVTDLKTDCRYWGDKTPWVERIYVNFGDEPRSVLLYVVPADAESVTVESRRAVAYLGLIIGATYDVRCEARIIESIPPEEAMKVFSRNADEQ